MEFSEPYFSCFLLIWSKELQGEVLIFTCIICSIVKLFVSIIYIDFFIRITVTSHTLNAICLPHKNATTAFIDNSTTHKDYMTECDI